MTRIIKRDQLFDSASLWVPGAARPAQRGEASATSQTSAQRQVDLAAVEESARQQGLRHGMGAAEEVYRAKLAKLEALAASLKAERQQFFERIEPELVRLSVTIAEKIIGSELELRPDTVVGLVRGAMLRLRDREMLRVSVNPRDADRVKEARDDLIAAVDGVRKLEVIEDRRVDVGGCVIESGNGTLDARIKTQMDEIARVLGDMLPGAEEAGDSERGSPSPASSEV
jgi:flagellar assembly protein FliH